MRKYLKKGWKAVAGLKYFSPKCEISSIRVLKTVSKSDDINEPKSNIQKVDRGLFIFTVILRNFNFKSQPLICVKKISFNSLIKKFSLNVIYKKTEKSKNLNMKYGNYSLLGPCFYSSSVHINCF